MCGHVGMAGDLNGTYEKAFKQMLVFDSVRGEDSTGILGVKKHDLEEYNIAKQVGNPFEVMNTMASRDIFMGSSRILLGHNRYATQGKVNKANAHPFDFDTLVGAHNGTLNNKWQLDDAQRFDVDSENLYHHIEKNGLEAAMRIAQGAWALVWWDKIENTINFLRNKERPLYYTLAEDKVLAWASEDWMLDVAMQRNGIKYNAVEEFEVGMLYSVQVAKGGKLGKPIVRPIEFAPKKDPVVYPIRQGPSLQGNNSVQKSAVNNSTESEGVFTAPAGQVAGTKPVSRSVANSRFMQEKAVLLEAVCIQEEKNGSEYVLCFSPDQPYYEIRLYRSGTGVDMVFNDVGCEFEGDVSRFVCTGPNNSGYYKVAPSSVKILSSGIPSDPKLPDETYPDSGGKEIGYQQWRKKYGCCAFCTDNVEPTDLDEGARFTTQDNIFCKSCAEDEEVHQYVTFI